MVSIHSIFVQLPQGRSGSWPPDSPHLCARVECVHMCACLLASPDLLVDSWVPVLSFHFLRKRFEIIYSKIFICDVLTHLIGTAYKSSAFLSL